MTKERRVAIKQWQDILLQLFQIKNNNRYDLGIIKPATKYEYVWRCNCWFCTYVRACEFASCKKCPLFKYSVAKHPQVCQEYTDYERSYCGCSGEWSLYDRVMNINNDIYDRIAACKLIIQALKGYHIWEREKEE